MRLMTHNFLMCNVANCKQNNYPLLIEVEKSIFRDSPFSSEKITATSKKIDWLALYKTVTSMGQTNFPMEPAEHLQNPQFLKKLHRILFDTHILSGKLLCPNCKREYPIVNGIPNMILNESEI